MRLTSWIGHRVRELTLLPQIARSGSKPRVAFFPSSVRAYGGMLRSYNIAEALNDLGWHAITVPKQLEFVQRQRLMRWFRPDLIVFQTCRHPLNHADHAMGYRWVLDLDDADFHFPAIVPQLEATVRGAAGVIAGSRYVRDWAAKLNPQTQVIWTGTPLKPGSWPDQANRGPVIAWAQYAPLDYPAELAFVQGLHARLVSRGVPFRLRLYGAAGPEAAARLRAVFGSGADLELVPPLSYDAFLQSLREVAVGLSPIIASSPFSRGKSFGKILGYLDAGVPVVSSDEADHKLFFTAQTGVVSNDPAVWEDAIFQLLRDPGARQRMATAASVDFTARLSTQTAARHTDAFLCKILAA